MSQRMSPKKNKILKLIEGDNVMFSYINTVKIYSNEDISETLISYLCQSDYKRILIISGGNNSMKFAEELIRKLSNFETLLISGVVSNPLEEKIVEIATASKKFGSDIIITIGGGSVHDTGKAVAIMHYDVNNSLEDYTVTGKLSVQGIKKVLPLITIPTLIGSGAEVSPAALIRFKQKKKVIFSPLLHPQVCFCDLTILSRIDKKILSRSIFDSFIQSLEGYISSKANPLSQAYSLESMRLILENKTKLIDGKLDKNNIENLVVASFFSSYVCSLASVGAIHALSNPLSGIYNIHHADALSLVTIPVLQYNLPKTNANLEKLNLLFNNHLLGLSKSNEIEILLENIKLLISELISFTVQNREEIHNDFSRLATDSFNSDMDGNPYDFSKDELESIFKEI